MPRGTVCEVQRCSALKGELGLAPSPGPGDPVEKGDLQRFCGGEGFFPSEVAAFDHATII
jgi:hypothetical protein